MRYLKKSECKTNEFTEYKNEIDYKNISSSMYLPYLMEVYLIFNEFRAVHTRL